jgi:predicted Fe-S protein YdhL (DUF1289 family)
MTETPNISSPCVRICVVDRKSGLCTGCGRTVKEIGGWLSMSEEQRRAIMAELPARRAKAKLTSPAG